MVSVVLPKHFRSSVCILFITASLFIFIIVTISFKYLIDLERSVECVDQHAQTITPKSPVVKIYGIQENENMLDVVKMIFSKLGYNIIQNDIDNWDVLWSHTYPFYTLRNEILNLKEHQKVNHFPGSGYITQKNNLALLPVDHIPKSFLLPANREEFMKYAEKNKNVFWMMKNSNHRGIRIINGSENLDVEGTFVQEFVKDPLLINGKKFDIGVYVVLTSIDPLRVFMYTGDILLRFCKKNYFPLDINSVESYVVGDDYLPIWEVPDLKYYFLDLNYTAKESLAAYLRAKGKSLESMWLQISKTVQDVYFSVEEDFKRSALSLGNIRNFFELVRFDFIADSYLNVYLLEVNMSPNLSPAHFPQNKLLYEQVTFSTFQLVGLVRKFGDIESGETEVSEKDIQVRSEQCSSKLCENSCKDLKCKICNHCLNKELKEIFKVAYIEFLNRGKFQRIIPVPTIEMNNKRIKRPSNLSQMNTYMDLWFRGKCLQDISWCQ